MIAYLNIDEVIRIIREADEPKPALMKKFKLSVEQAEAILEIKLRQLAKLEETKIRAEQDELSKEREELEQILESPKRLKTLVKKELQEDSQKYGDERRCQLVEREEAKALREEEVISVENVTVVLSEQGWIRVAKGHEIDPLTLSYKAGDSFKQAAFGRSNQLAVFLDSTGRTYALPAHKLPSASRLNTLPGATFEGVIIGNPEQLVLLASDAGYGFIAKLEDLYTKNRSGKATLNLPKNSKALPPRMIADVDSQYLAAITNEGRMLLFPIACLPILGLRVWQNMKNMWLI
jgi:topoisomerase-4 subunit A